MLLSHHHKIVHSNFRIKKLNAATVDFNLESSYYNLPADNLMILCIIFS